MKFLKDLSTSQIWAQARNAISYVAGIATALGIMTVATSSGLVDNVNAILDSIEKIVASVTVIAGAVVTIINMVKASRAASPASAVERVQLIANTPGQPQTTEAKEALVAATNSIDEVQGVVMAPTAAGRKLAESIPAPTVVPAGTTDAIAVARGELP